MATWPEAIKAFLLALPGIAWIIKRFLVRKDKKEADDAVDNANQVAADLDPDAIGGGLRRGVHRK